MAITAQTRTEIVQLVVSMLGEAPSAAMLTDLVTKANAGSTVQELADSLATNAAFTSQFPVWQTSTEFTKKIVNNMFAGGTVSQADTDAAIDYIAGAITAGTFSKTSAVVALTSYMASAEGAANASYGSVSQSYQNKVAVAEYYTITKGLGDGTAAERKAAIAGVTADAATVTAEKAAVDTSATAAAVIPGSSQTLTTGTDVKNGGAGDDSFLGVVGATSTLNAGDLLTGGAGEDTLQITLTGGADLSLSGVVSNSIEKYMVSNFTTVDVADDSVDMSQAGGIKTISLSGSNTNGDTVFTNVGAIVNAEMLSGQGDLTITNTAAAVVGTADVASLTLSGQTVSTFTEAGAAGGLETLNVASNGATNDVDITSTNNSLKTVNISGASKLTSTVASSTLATVNAADMTGKFNLTTNVTGDLTVTGGSADDTFTFAGTTYTNADVIDGGGGIDSLIMGTAVTAASTLKNVSNVEALVMTGGADVTLAGDANIMNFVFSTDTGANALVLNAGVTAPAIVTLGLTGVDTVNNAASTALTVNGVAAAIDLSSAITGGALGADTINITADTNNDVAIAMSTMTNIDVINVLDFGDAAITAAKKASGKDVSLTTAGYATAITIDATALDAAITDDDGNLLINDADESAEKLTVDGTLATKVLTIKGGEAGDTITGGSANDIIHGNGGADTIILTAGGNDTVEGGAGNDTISAGATLTALDTIDGGDGIDTLSVTNLAAANLAGVSNVEVLAFNGTVNLATDLSFDSLNLTAGSNPDSVTFSTGYTNATTVTLEDNDTVINNAKIALAVSAKASDLESGDNVTITGSATAVDTMTVSATSSSMVTSGSITNVDSITVTDAGDAATGAKAAGKDFDIDLTSYGTKLILDASALDVAGIDSNSNGKIQANDASNEKLTITGASAKALTVTGGGADDTIVGSSDAAAGDTINAGAGDDVINMGANLSYLDTIDGGAAGLTGTGDSIMVAIDQDDVNFMNVTNVTNLLIDEGNISTNVLGAYFSTSGIASVSLDPTHVSTISAAGTTSGVTYVARGAQNEAITAGIGDDSFVFGATGTLDANDVINGGAGNDTVAITNTQNGALGVTVNLANITKVENVVTTGADGDDTTTFDADPVTVTFSSIANGVTSYAGTVSGASITDTKDVFTVNAAPVQDLTYNLTIIGGAAADVLVGGSGSDTIQGGTGADKITGGVGSDTLTGGTGKDDFLYALASSQSTNLATDSITDFATASDEVRISLTAPTAGTTYDFTNKGNAASSADALSLLSSVKGQFYFNTATQTVVLDTDGNGLAQAGDFAVKIGTATLGAADIAFDITTNNTADTVTTGAGNDTIVSAVAGDVLKTGAGNDKISTAVGSTGGFTFGTGTDTLALTGASDQSGNTITGLEIITMANGANATLTAAQLATFNGTSGFAITGTSSETVTIAGDTAAATNTAAAITATEADFLFTADNAADVFVGNSGDDIVTVPGGTGLASFNGGAGTLDTIAVTTANYDASADTLISVERVTLTEDEDLNLGPAQAATMGLTTLVGTNGGNAEVVTVTGTGAADTINLAGITSVTDIGSILITGGAGIDTITASSGIDHVILGATAANASNVTSFATGTDKVGLVNASTTVTTAVGAARAISSTTTAGTGGGALALTGASTTADDVLIFDNVTAVGVNSGDLSAAVDGSELLKALTNASAADAYTGITATGAGDKGYMLAVQGGNSYVYQYDSNGNGTNTLVAADEIALIGTFTGTVLVAGDFVISS
ncbi:hypothetical protein N9S63_01875 [OM182 bacterium]|nr:hypothetical protein [OM182 bacterium]